MLADIGKSWCNSVNNNPKTVLDDKKNVGRHQKMSYMVSTLKPHSKRILMEQVS
jgi:hypothetical protein